MSMTYDEARADAARIIAEHDALYGSPEQWQARELHQRARQLRKAERAKQQKQADARVAKHHQMLAAREAERQQPQPRTKEEWSKALTAFNSANPGWLAWWNDCLKMAYGDGAVEMAAFKSETLSIEEFKAKEEAVRTPSGHLFLLLSQLNHHLRTEICKEQIEPLQQELKQHAAVADDERGKVRSELDNKQRQIAALRAELSQQSEFFERRIAVFEARLSEQQRIANIEARSTKERTEGSPLVHRSAARPMPLPICPLNGGASIGMRSTSAFIISLTYGLRKTRKSRLTQS